MLSVVFVVVVVVGLVYVGLQWFLEPYYVARKKNREKACPPQEQEYITSSTPLKFPKPWSSTATCSLSVIIPAYNEEDRLSIMMEETMAYLKQRASLDGKFTYEVIIVDDASKDKTVELATSMISKYGSEIKVLRLAENHGKGGAIRKGILRASGDLVLMVDADGATLFKDIEKLEAEMINDNNPMIVIGSRAHLEQEAIASRHFIRNFLMVGFHFIVSILFSHGVRDTQCGFKLFNRRACELIFPAMHIERWAFDVEILFLAGIHDIRVKVSD